MREHNKKNLLRYLEHLSNSVLVTSLIAYWLTVAVLEPMASETITRALSSSIPSTCHTQRIHTPTNQSINQIQWQIQDCAGGGVFVFGKDMEKLKVWWGGTLRSFLPKFYLFFAEMLYSVNFYEL